MNGAAAAWNLAPLLGVIGAGTALALVPLLWFWRRRRGAGPVKRLHALSILVLFLSFDLVLLGAYTRLSDSGLGCPDWPGCYGHASPIGASVPIAAAQAQVPTGAVTLGKAWTEMAHRYAATAVGLLVFVLAGLAWRASRRAGGVSARWALLTLAWICVQGAFGALTVTQRLYPAIVTLHLLGGMGLLALLAIQAETYAPQRLALGPQLRAGLVIVAVLALAQIALGGWVSSNYAVLACRDFPTCQGAWWPEMDGAEAFVLQRPLGASGRGDAYLPFAALTAIHVAHRFGALVFATALALLSWRMVRAEGAVRRWAFVLLGLLAWQAASGLGNVLLGWPLAAAVAHTAGAAGVVVALTVLLMRSAPKPATRLSADGPRAQALAS